MTIIYFITGILAGIVGGLSGTGGCALMMPVIRFGFDFSPALAVGTTLTAVVYLLFKGPGKAGYLLLKFLKKEGGMHYARI